MDWTSDGEAPVMLELWGMRSTPSLLLSPCTFWPGVVASDKIIPIVQIGLLDKLRANK